MPEYFRFTGELQTNELVCTMKSMVRKSGDEARAAILDAAVAEFAAFGVAGSRIDRIAAASGASKERLYAYFGSKELLFAEVMRVASQNITSAVKLEGADLLGYVGRMVDYFDEHPEWVRMSTWNRLEAGDEELGAEDIRFVLNGTKLDAIAVAQTAGEVDAGWQPGDLLMLLYSIAAASAAASPATMFVANARDPLTPDDRRSRRREAAIEAARRLITPQV